MVSGIVPRRMKGKHTHLFDVKGQSRNVLIIHKGEGDLEGVSRTCLGKEGA